MTIKNYNWKRFWCPREGTINLTDGGYLYDPDSEFGKYYNPDLVTFESIAKAPCLVLLGEPGIGKTKTMKAEHERIKMKDINTIWLNLRSYGSEDRLVKNLFENNTFAFWRNNNHQLYIFLDSLDECLLRIDNIAYLLIDEFNRYPVKKQLYLRIASRTAVWPVVIEKELKKLWGDNSVGVFELAPLRRIDVIETAKTAKIDPMPFLQEIDQKEAVPFAIKPITLNFLLETYCKKSQLPDTKLKLYFEGCRLLCSEISESRITSKRIGNLSTKQRLAIAARIAALTIFANRYAIWTDIDRGDVPEECITIDDLCSKTENINGSEFEVDKSSIMETLDIGLFSSRGPKCISWAHHTYAEFLAAQYLVINKVPSTQIMNMIVHPGDPEGKLVPQLYETAAWLASMEQDVFHAIMKTDPDVLLKSDLTTVKEKDRANLVDHLLRLYDEGKLLPSRLDIFRNYKKLDHSNLEGQLRPYICDSTKEILVRREAINIAEACKLQALQHDLANIAVDSNQPSKIRLESAYAVVHIGDSEAKSKLKPLISLKETEDQDNELKGCALQALWPEHMTTEELFNIITIPKNRSFYGAYHLFLSKELLNNISPQDLPIALKWLMNQGFLYHIPPIFHELVDGIILKAWENIELPDVLESLVQISLKHLKNHYCIIRNPTDPQFVDIVSNNDKKRHLFIEKILPMISDSLNLIYELHSSIPFVLNKDIPWMIEQLNKSESEQIQKAWARLIRISFDQHDSDQINAVLDASERSTILEQELDWIIRPVMLNSQEATEMKNYFLGRKRPLDFNKEYVQQQSTIIEQIDSILAKCESGNSIAFENLNLPMMQNAEGNYNDYKLEPDIMQLPGWTILNEEIRIRIVEAAKKYILKQDLEALNWIAKEEVYYPIFIGYRALKLLIQKAPTFISTISNNIWEKWAPIFFADIVTIDHESDESYCKILKIAYQHAPNKVIESLMIVVDKENEKHGNVFIIDKIKGCWDDRLAKALMQKAKDINLKPKALSSLLAILLDNNVKEAKEYAESLVVLPLPSKVNGQSREVIAAKSLMLHSKESWWSAVWPAINEYPEFGKELISSAAFESPIHTALNIQVLTEEQLAELYNWLMIQYPQEEDPKWNENENVSRREMVAMWRNSLLDHLEKRSTRKSCEAIKRIADKFPKLNWLNNVLLKAQNNYRRHAWIPLKPSEILDITRNKNAVLIQNGDQLLDVLIESLKRLEEELQGETPAARDLWDKINKDKYKPVDENAFSDYIKRYLLKDLKQRAIIPNREVEIRRSEKTDIHVDAAIRDLNGKFYDIISTIIEVKGCWHPQLFSAMETQLFNRYLKDNPCNHGLYLVGWFNCDKWDDKESKAPKLTINKAKKKLDKQAVELSKQGKRIKALVINTALK